jgi:hypothetical protein
MLLRLRVLFIAIVLFLVCLQLSLGCGGSSQTLGTLPGCTVTTCAAGQTWDSLQCSCVPVLDGGCPETPAHCLEGYVFDPQTCQCVLPIGHDAGADSACVQVTCGAGQVWASTECACVDAADAGCLETPSPCAAGYVYDPQSCTCVLSGQIPDGGADSTLTVSDAGGCSGTCGAGETWDPLQCACVPTLDAPCPATPAHCAVGYVADPLTCQCVQCVQSACAAGATWSAEACACVSSSCPAYPLGFNGPCTTEGLTCPIPPPLSSCTCKAGAWSCSFP